MCFSLNSRQVLKLGCNIEYSDNTLRMVIEENDQTNSAKVQDRGLANKLCWTTTTASYYREFCMCVLMRIQTNDSPSALCCKLLDHEHGTAQFPTKKHFIQQLSGLLSGSHYICDLQRTYRSPLPV